MYASSSTSTYYALTTPTYAALYLQDDGLLSEAELTRFREDVEPHYPPAGPEGSATFQRTSYADTRRDSEGSMASVEWEGIIMCHKAAIEAEEDGMAGDEGSDEESEEVSEDDFDDMGGGDYKSVAVEPLDLSLFYVNLETYKEAMPVFYGGIHFTLDLDGETGMKSLRSLPGGALQYIFSITIPSTALMIDDGRSRRAWTGSGGGS